MRRFVSGMMVLWLASSAGAQTPAFDPREWKGAQAGPPTQVLTLGSTHLSQLKTAVSPEMLAPLLDKLAAFKPDIITHEGVSGEQCDTLKRYGAKYPGMFDTYCWPTDDAEKATGLAIPAAMAEIDKVLAAWPARPAASQRRAYLAWWEVRNLHMVSNIRTAFGNSPGSRVLNVVGSSHKPYYDAYLNLMSDVTLVDAEQVLK